MSEPRDYAELVARVLARRVREPRGDGAARDHGISSVAHAMAERERRRKATRYVLTGGVALVAAGALAFFGASFRERQHVERNGSVLVGRAGELRYAPGTRIVASSGPVSVHFGPVTRLELQARTEVLYEAGGTTRRFRLLRGAVHLRVEKLVPKDRFIVETPDAEVEVRGTEFDVSFTPEATRCSSPTRVKVVEGAVELRLNGESRRLSAGQEFAPCNADAAPVEHPSEQDVSMAPSSAKLAVRAPKARHRASLEPSVRAAPSSSPASRGPVVMESSLAAQNELYARAVAAMKSGRSGEALGAYYELLTRFPGGPLEESAAVERMRLLAMSDRSRARSAARNYLERFPRGFARAEALELVRQP